ncbi:NADH-quinone oxidoreductase subunit A [Planctomycetales bacterium 10988]|nr:NADH-quinone oxidoreductase subunit A [Planctomycetales bacterium 10988]
MEGRSRPLRMQPTIFVGTLAFFFLVGGLFVFVNLLVGWLFRPSLPNPEKEEIYECGEPTIGSSYFQFDLRFYVVALLFLVFDVEVAFFFPWANVYGTAVQMMSDVPLQENPDVGTVQPDGAVAHLYERLSAPVPAAVPLAEAETLQQEIQSTGSELAGLAMVDLLVFFAVLLVGFFYLWKRGDLDWVRAAASQRRLAPARRTPVALREREPPLTTVSS